ncbi:MAG: hypothetical protein ACM3XM_05035, partial [Mycobacterium leprae]
DVRQEGHQIMLTNPGPGYAFFPMIDLDDPRYHWQVSGNGPLLAPGESVSYTLTLTDRTERAEPDFPFGRKVDGPVTIQVSGWNVAPIRLTWEA